MKESKPFVFSFEAQERLQLLQVEQVEQISLGECQRLHARHETLTPAENTRAQQLEQQILESIDVDVQQNQFSSHPEYWTELCFAVTRKMCPVGGGTGDFRPAMLATKNSMQRLLLLAMVILSKA